MDAPATVVKPIDLSKIRLTNEEILADLFYPEN